MLAIPLIFLLSFLFKLAAALSLRLPLERSVRCQCRGPFPNHHGCGLRRPRPHLVFRPNKSNNLQSRDNGVVLFSRRSEQQQGEEDGDQPDRFNVFADQNVETLFAGEDQTVVLAELLRDAYTRCIQNENWETFGQGEQDILLHVTLSIFSEHRSLTKKNEYSPWLKIAQELNLFCDDSRIAGKDLPIDPGVGYMEKKRLGLFVDVLKKNDYSVKYGDDGYCVWSSNTTLQSLDDDKAVFDKYIGEEYNMLMSSNQASSETTGDEPDALLNDLDGDEHASTGEEQGDEPNDEGPDALLLDGSALARLAGGSSPSRELEVAAETIALLVNDPIDTFPQIQSPGEMVLQQVINSTIPRLFLLFGGVLYKADERVACSHIVNCRILPNEDRYSGVGVACNPDAAILLTDVCNVIAVMEVKSPSKPNVLDMFRCITLTTVSLLACRDTARDKRCTYALKNLAIPFVIGSGYFATLYVTCFKEEKTKKPREQWIPKVYEVSRADMRTPGAKRRLVARLAVLLSRVTKFKGIPKIRYYFPLCIPDGYPNIFSDDIFEGTSGSVVAKQDSRKKHTERGESSAIITERDAQSVASHDGLVSKVRFPWLRNILSFREQEGPIFYFRGNSNAEGGGREVFCKVFYDEGSSKRNIKSAVQRELDFTKLANQRGIPSPALVDSLTTLDVPHPRDDSSSAGKKKWHVITTDYVGHRVGVIQKQDIVPYALRLIQAVRKMHNIGLLHCDLKPSNAPWNHQDRRVALVDFGHAQWMSKAKSYPSTAGFEAPEVVGNAKEPHSSASEAYAVGKTLVFVCEKVLERGSSSRDDGPANDNGLRKVIEVGERLSMDAVDDRMSLDDAEQVLVLLEQQLKGHEIKEEDKVDERRGTDGGGSRVA